MRLAKLSYQFVIKKSAQKCDQHQQQQQTVVSSQTGTEYTIKGQLAFVKRCSGSHSFYSHSNSGSLQGSESARGSGSGSAVGFDTDIVQKRQRHSSIGNGSCISTATATTTTTTTNSTKRRKSKAKKCFGSTVFRCCLPCRGGGSAAPATSPPQSPVQTFDDLKCPEKLGLVDTPHQQQQENQINEKYQLELDGRTKQDYPLDGSEPLITEKKHSLADTIGTSVTTPISLKTLINDVDEDLEQQLSAADIAVASLATGILARKAEPETLSDASVSPTAAVLLATGGNSASAIPLLTPTSTTTIVYSAVSTSSVNVTSRNTEAIIAQPSTVIQPTTVATIGLVSSPINSAVANIVSTSGYSGVTACSSPQSSSTSTRCSCQPQTSPLPHIEEEEESEQHLQNNKHQSSVNISSVSNEPVQLQNLTPDQLLPINATAAVFCGSCESVHQSSGTSSSQAQAQTDFVSASTPSPRIKLKFRKPHKSCWSRIVLAPIGSSVSGIIGSNSNETLASTGSTSNTNNSSSASVTGAVANAAHHRLASSSSSALASHPSNSQLVPAKMQAEQGSICDLQKYHSRYLKNRRHTLANVR